MATLEVGPDNTLKGNEDVRFSPQPGMGRTMTEAARSWTGVAVALVCAVLVMPVGAEESEHRVFRTDETVRFVRKCADATAHQVQAYAELQSGDGRAHALVQVYARHDAVRRGETFIGARLVALRIEAGVAGVGAPWSLRLEARAARGAYVGAEHTHYDSNPARGEGERRAFRTDATGALVWLDFAEPGDEGARGGYPHNWSPEMETTAAALGLSDAEREVSLDLVLAEVDSGDELRLRGPTLWIPDRIWHERPPKPKVLGLLAALNPFEPGGIVQTLARGAKYDECLDERRSVKRRFAQPG